MRKFEWIFLTDVDGTLDYHCTGIDEKTYKAASDFASAGGGLGIATGRAIVSTEEIALRLHVNVPCILYGGAMLYDFETRMPVWMSPLRNEIRKIADKVTQEMKEVSVLIFTDTGISIMQSNEMLFSKGVPEECNPIYMDRPVTGNILKLNMCGERDALEYIERTYFPDRKYNFTYANRHFAEVVSPGAGKSKAMEVLSGRYKLPLERFIAMGDGQNDLEMLKKAGTSYTLDNASDEIKEAADLVLPHCDENGAALGFSLAMQKMRRTM